MRGSDYHTAGTARPGTASYEYPNSQEPGTLWFHDHALGITHLNVHAGLAGFYFLKDPNTEPRGYPDGPQEIEMAVQDRMFDTTGQLYLPTQQPTARHPFWSPIFEGDVAVVNGAAFPYLNVEPKRYRLHILNGSLNRGYTFVFGNAPVYLVGSDDNYFDKPVALAASSSGAPAGLSVSPGERADIIVDFSKFAGRTIELTNSQPGQDIQLPDIMLFRVATATSTPGTNCDPANPDASTGLCARKSPMAHLTDGSIYLQGAIMAPTPAESGWKDRADAHAGEVLRILVRWMPSSVPFVANQSYAGQNLYPFDPTQGYYVWHCHVITHEDNEMMRPYRVTN